MTIAAVLGSKGDDVVTVPSTAPVGEAVGLLAEHRIGALPVVNDGRLEGIMSERDVVYCIRAHGREVLDWPVSKVMTESVITAEPSTPVLAALALMTQRRVRHLPVLEDGELRGIVSIGDLVKHRMERIEAEAEAMRAYIQS